MKYIVTINNNSYEVEVEKGEARLVKTTEVAAAPVTAQIVTTSSVPDTAPATPTPAAPPVTAGEKITAPMPGVILQIKKIGETILILEAMKMENEVIAPRDGVIAQITAVKGASVNTGDVLAVLQ
jgi:biotin carboxyl carrier protein